jgi:hypothetical protein
MGILLLYPADSALYTVAMKLESLYFPLVIMVNLVAKDGRHTNVFHKKYDLEVTP